MRFDRKLGFLSVNLWVFILYIVWGWRGNIYGKNKRVLRFDFGRDKGVHRFKVLYVSRYLTTDVYVYRLLQPWKWNWNSEHLAAKYGQTQGGETGPEWIVWDNRWFGQHVIC